MGEAIREDLPLEDDLLPPFTDLTDPTERSEEQQAAPDLRFLNICAGVLLCIAALTVLHLGKPVFFPIVLAIVLNLLLSPAVRYLYRLGMPNPLAAILVLVVTFAVLGAGISRLVDPAATWIEQLPRRARQLEMNLRALMAPFAELSEAGERLAEATDMSGNAAAKVTVAMPGTGDGLLTLTGSFVAQLLVAIVLLYFFLSAGDRFLSKSVGVVPRLQDKKRVVEIGRTIERSISIYLLSIAGINIALGFSIGVAMWLLGMPNAPLWGMMAAVVNFVPYLGSITGLAVISVVALTTFDSTFYALTVASVYFLLDTLEGAVLTPLVLGYQFDLSPPIILMWLLLWGWLWGIPGVLLAVPMLTAIKIICDHLPTLQPVAVFLSK